MAFRYAIAALIAAIGSIALTANSYLLASGALRWAGEHDAWQRLALAAGGAVVPWMLATIPLLFITIPKSSGLFSRFGQRMLILTLWFLFFFYNFLMGTSNIAQLREDKVASHQHTAETVAAARDRRSVLREQLTATPQHRPAATVERLLLAEQANRRWTSSNQCTDATATASRAFCDAYRTLEGELESARAGDKLTAEIAAVDAQIAAAPPMTDANADPFVTALSLLFGIQERWVRVLLAMATPVILEVLGASCWKFAAGLFGWSLKAGMRQDDYERHDLIASPERMRFTLDQPFASLDVITRQREFLRWFLRENAKPNAAGSMSEEEWYGLYAEICRSHNDHPVPMEMFRREAARLHGIIIQNIEGTTHYSGYLPMVPAT
jgi:hypothetical protein